MRKLWRGALTNTVFVLLEPDGETPLSRGGRSPEMAIGPPDVFYAKMDEVANDFKPKASVHEAIVPDALTFRQALNTASCDQRPLVLVSVATESDLESMEERLRKVAWHPSITGCFHWDFVANDTEWQEVVSGSAPDQGIIVIRPDKFGLKGEVMASFDGDESSGALVNGLKDAFFDFQQKHEPKEYENHRREGKRKGITFEQELEQKEER